MSESSPPQGEPPPAVSAPESDILDTSPVPATGKPAEDDCRASKRRRNCPESLDKLQEPSEPDRSRHQSFTFHTSAAPAPEFTPKFGSFKLPEAEPEPAAVEKQRAAAPDGGVATAGAEEEEEGGEAANGITGNWADHRPGM